MSDDEWWPTYVTPTEPMPAEPLFEFVRGSDQAPMSCEFGVTWRRAGGPASSTSTAVEQPLETVDLNRSATGAGTDG
jgi:hypothetical protein